MDKKKMEYIAVAVLAVVFFILLMSRMASDKTKKTRAESGMPTFADKVTDTTLGKTIAEQLGGREAYQKGGEAMFRAKDLSRKNLAVKEAMWGRDPFILKEVGTGGAISSLKVMGITTGTKTKPMAIINNEIVGMGSKIGQYEVTQISKDRVTLTDGKENFDLLLEQ